jgi:hypothetical protein
VYNLYHQFYIYIYILLCWIMVVTCLPRQVSVLNWMTYVSKK